MMKKFFIRIFVAFLLFSLTAETFSSLFFANKEQVSFIEKEEQEDVQKEKEEPKKEDNKDKSFPACAILFRSIDPSSLYTGYLHPELITRYCDPPELPPNQV